MNKHIPSFEDVRKRLAPLGHGQIQQLSALSGVPWTTLWKIKNGPTTNPGIETVRQFWSHIEKVEKAGA